MHIVKKSLAFALATIALAGCDKGIGVSADVSNSADGGESVKVSKGNEFAVGKGVKASASMPTSALITDAMRPFHPVVAPTLTPAGMRGAFLNEEIDTKQGPMQTAGWLQEASGKFTKTTFEEGAKQIGADLQSFPPEYRLIAAEKLKCLKLALDDRAKGDACLWHFHLVGMSAEAIVSAHASVVGWEVDAMHPSTDKAKEKLYKYTFGNMALAEYANMIEGEIAGKISGLVMKDPAAAQLKIQQVIFAIPTETFVAASENSQKIAAANQSGLTIDMVTGKGIGWMAGGAMYTGNEGGLQIKRNGVDWFGAGNINGKRYELGLESAISASTTTKTTTEFSEGAKSSTGTTGSAAVK